MAGNGKSVPQAAADFLTDGRQRLIVGSDFDLLSRICLHPKPEP
jgi:hypothetical protein